jgi:hypothetical protein
LIDVCVGAGTAVVVDVVAPVLDVLGTPVLDDGTVVVEGREDVVVEDSGGGGSVVVDRSVVGGADVSGTTGTYCADGTGVGRSTM